MGHAITYFDFDLKVDRAAAQEMVNQFCRENCDPLEHGGIPDVIAAPIVWKNSTKPFADFQAAKEFLFDGALSNPYVPVAVQYRTEGEPSGATISLNERYERLLEEIRLMREKALPRNRKSAFIGCPECGSKLSREHLGDQWKCPVCDHDLRAPSAVRAIDSKQVKLVKTRDMLHEARMRDGRRAPIRWAVIAEVHC